MNFYVLWESKIVFIGNLSDKTDDDEILIIIQIWKSLLRDLIPKINNEILES